MSELQIKDRFLRSLPGRLRIEICGLKESKKTAELLIAELSRIDGVHKVDPCPSTGRLLLVYDQTRLGLQRIFDLIGCFEAKLLHKPSDDQPMEGEKAPCCEAQQTKREAAAAAETDIVEIPHSIKTLPVMPDRHEDAGGKIPLPLTLAVGGLAVLGVKQLFMGRSALARSPTPFYLSALVSVATGFPFLRRGLQNYSENKRWNSDIVLGGSALALALIRENLVVLAGLSILQYVNWRRTQAALEGHRDVELPPSIRNYSEKASKLGLLAAGAAWAITRNPLRGVAVLLAANPRPATIPAQCAWNQAELVCKQRNLPLPEQSSLSALANTKSIIVDDAALLFDQNAEDVQYIGQEEDPDKVICLAASLMEKSSHPWREPIREKAKRTCRTIRTAFHVEEQEHCVRGKINDAKLLIASPGYIQYSGIECSPYMLEAKRLERKGFDVLFVVKESQKPELCLGLLVRQQQLRATAFCHELTALMQKGWDAGILHNRRNVPSAQLEKLGFHTEWSDMLEGETLEQIAAKRQMGEHVLLVTGSEQSPTAEYFAAAGVPSVAADQFSRLVETCEYAEQIGQTVDQHFQITKRWNVLGGALATFGVLSAPVVNLAGDALSLIFMSRSKKISENAPRAELADPYPDEAAAASETVCPHAASKTVCPHAAAWETIADQYRVDHRFGLTEQQAQLSRTKFGCNQLECKKPTPWLISYLSQFKEFTTLILLGTSALAFFTGGLFDGAAMSAVLLANAAIGTVQERKAEKVVEMLNRFQPPNCKVVRDGQHMELSATGLVPGDIVHMEAGDRVPADIRLIRCWNFQVNEAALTGESVPVEKNEAPIAADSALPDRVNMVFMGTDVCRGKGIGVVANTGMNTEMGLLMSCLKKDDKEITPLQHKVTSISKAFVKGALVAGGLVFITGLLRGIPVSQMISTSITLAASAIPEGLPVTITIALSAGIFRMAHKNALTRKLSALETLGRTTVICTDKTGTLTKNEMTVKSIATVDKLWTVTGNGYEPVGEIREVSDDAAATAAAPTEEDNANDFEGCPELHRVLQIGVLCNNSKLVREDEQWIIKGDPTEGALLSLAAKRGMWQQNMTEWRRGAEMPFDSNTGKMSVVCQDTSTGRDRFVFSKGAVETILGCCSRYERNGHVYDLTEEQKQQIVAQNEMLSGDALRVLAFAYRSADTGEDENGIDEKEMIYVGMAGMIDPPKPDVDNNIREAIALGVKPVMITGDHPITAIAIAKQLGIYDGTQKLISGHELDRLSDEELHGLVENVSIFARVTPQHKLRIVTAFQKLGHIVAMTGDGVNDTPAIKQANVGIAMGRTGTEVTKETADVILQEDDFGTIVEGVKEGRTIIGNIRKALGCLLTGNLAEIIVTSAAVMVGLPIPLVPIQILLMNLLTDALPAMILAVGPGDKTKLTKRTDIADKALYQKVVTRGVLLGVGSLGLFAASLAAGAPVAVAQTTAFAALVAGQLMQTFSWRQEGSEQSIRDWSRDRFLVGALGISWLALFAALYVPPVASFFHTVPLSLHQWLPVLLVAASVTLLSKPVLSMLARRGETAPAAPDRLTAGAAAAV